jgi:hypothetical protein
MVFGCRRILVVVRAMSPCAALVRFTASAASVGAGGTGSRSVPSWYRWEGPSGDRRGGICRSGRERSWLCRGVRELVQVSGLVRMRS